MPPPTTSPCFTPVGLSPPVCTVLTSQSCPNLFPITWRRQHLLSFTYFIMPWIKRVMKVGCGCVSGRDGEPASESGRHPPEGDLRVLPAALREWDPVQESKSALFGPPWRPVKKNLASQKLPQTKTCHSNSLTINHLSLGSTWVEHFLFLSWLLPPHFLPHADCTITTSHQQEMGSRLPLISSPATSDPTGDYRQSQRGTWSSNQIPAWKNY